MRTRVFRLSLSLLVILVLLSGVTLTAAAKPAGTVNVQILALNDFHGALEPGSSGGAEYLATHIKTLEATNPYTLVVTAGDSVGASPLLSGLFHDEPTIEAFNLIGVDFSTVGNHEFDEGVAELQRLQEGGCHPVAGCQDGDPFEGAEFRYLAANVILDKNGKTLFPAYKIRSFEGAKVAFIGIGYDQTPTIVTPAGVEGVAFQKEIDTINALVPEIRAQGVEAIVVLLHNGATTPSNPYPAINDCVTQTSDGLTPVVSGIDPAVDVIVSGHAHGAYKCLIDGRLVTGAGANGSFLTDIDLTIDRGTGDVVSMAANNLSVTKTVAVDPAMKALLDKYRAIAAPISNRVIGSVTADIVKATSSSAMIESALGDVIADAQLWATTPAENGGSVIAFMNPGGIRANFYYSQISGGEAPGEVTFGEAFIVQPFSNDIVTMTLTGVQIHDLLEQQWVANRMLQVSAGFSYAYSPSAPVGQKVDLASITLNGAQLDPAASYGVTMNSFLSTGGDGFTVFTQGADKVIRPMIDLDALVAYFEANSPVAPGPMNRITIRP